MLTTTGGMAGGLSREDAEILAWKVQEADLGTQGASDAYRHGLCTAGSGEDCRAKVQQFINSEFSKGTIDGLANAIHDVQDVAARGHGYHEYGGLKDFFLSGEFVPHLAGDLMLGDIRGIEFKQVSTITSSMIKSWIGLNPSAFSQYRRDLWH